MGPMVGPTIGPRVQTIMATPLFSLGIVSASDAAPRVNGADPPMPAKMRNAIMLPELGATEHATLKMRNKRLPALYRT